ncbi:aldo/keto reductase [Pseudonocardia ailaonensis]|uniref:Aldo/keto reductase n=1 Tax=Pseudonocardia ailaonensis TaxID=367279 RepID=A0ABN2MGS5_9PSEU
MLEHYRVLGRTGIRVSPLALGTMNFGSYGRMSAADCATVLARALDAGINLVDTADVYSHTESEALLGEALAARRDEVVLVSKFHHPIDDDPNHRGSSRRWIHRAVEGSLRRLRTDHLDVYLAHRPDADTPLEETVDALADLVRAGKIRHYGTSTFPSAQLVEAQWLGRARGVRPAVEQPPYSVLARGIERDLLPVAREYGLGTMVWSPLAGGWLSGRYREEPRDPAWQRWRNPQRHDPRLPANEAKAAAVARLGTIAAEAGITMIQLALGFVLEHPGVTSAVVGPRTVEHLEPQLAAAGTVLPRDVLDAIDEVVPPGVTLNPGDLGHTPPALARPELRRRNGR